MSLLYSLIKAGSPLQGNIVLVGPPGAGKSVFCETLLAHFLSNATKCLYISLERPPSDVMNWLKQVGKLSDIRLPLVFVDGYSWRTGGAEFKYTVTNLSDLNELSVKVFIASNEVGERPFYILDSLSNLVNYNSENDVLRFTEISMARLKKLRSFGMFVVEQGVHTPSFYSMLNHLADGVFQMKLKEDEEVIRRYFRVHSLRNMSHSTRWVGFTVSDGIFRLTDESGQPADENSDKESGQGHYAHPLVSQERVRVSDF